MARANPDPVMSGRKAAPALYDRGTLVAGRYRIEECLAWGGMGVVYAATHAELGHRVALKFLRGDLASDQEAIERFLEEARMAAGFRSEYVAHVLDFGHHEAVPYMVAEYLEGVDLWTVLDERGELDPSEAADFVAEACAGLAEVHAAGIVHRDLKPENLFLTRLRDGTCRIKLLDFGVSKRVDAGRCLTKPKKGVGSPLYMSPEQMRAQPIDARADVWALGTVLYELLTGHLPFDADSVAEICSRVLRSRPVAPRQFRPGLPAELEAVILRCLEKDRNKRYADVAELAVALVPFGGHAALRAAEESARILGRQLPRARRPRRRVSQPRLLAGLAAVAGIAGALILEFPSALASSQAEAPLTPPERALRSWVQGPELRHASAQATPEVERRHRAPPSATSTRKAPLDAPAAEPRTVVATAEAEPDPSAELGCPLPDTAREPEDPPSLEFPPQGSVHGDGPTVAPIEPARPPAAGAWQI